MNDWANDNEMKPQDRLIPWYFVLFFLVVFAVNAVFIAFATSTHSGVVRKDAYARGLAYNDVIKASESQQAADIKLVVTELTGDTVTLALQQQGEPVIGAKLSGVFRRSVHNRSDAVAIFEEIEPGLYQAQTPAEAGAWDLWTDVALGQARYHLTTRLIVPTSN